MIRSVDAESDTVSSLGTDSVGPEAGKTVAESLVRGHGGVMRRGETGPLEVGFKESFKALLGAALNAPVGLEGVKECGPVDSEGHAAFLCGRFAGLCAALLL